MAANPSGSEILGCQGPWADGEIYAIVEWMFDQSEKHGTFAAPAVDLSRGDPARGERILVAGDDGTNQDAKACVACHDVTIRTEALQIQAELMKGGWADTPVYWRDHLPDPARIEGPAIIEQMDTTILIEPGDVATGDGGGNLIIAVGGL